MGPLANTSLSATEERVVGRMIDALADAYGEALRAVWLFGSRARGESPRGEGSDVDLLVLLRDADSRVRNDVVDLAWDQAEAERDSPFRYSIKVETPEWLARRREIESFFIQGVDRDKVVLFERA